MFARTPGYIDGAGALAYGAHLMTAAGFGLALMNGNDGVSTPGNPCAGYAARAYASDPDG